MLCGAQRHRTRLLHNHQLAAPRYARPGEAGQVCGWAAGRVRPVCPIGLVAGEATGRQAGPQGQLQPIGSSPMVSRTPVRRPPGEARRLAGPGTRVGAPSLATVTSLPPPCLRHTNPDPRTVSWPTPCDARSTGVRGAVHAQSKASSASSSQQATRRTEARLLTNTLLNVCTGPSMACRRARAGARHVASCEELSPGKRVPLAAMASSLTELTEHSAVREVVGVKQDEAQAFALSLLPSLAVPWDTFVAGGLLSDRDVQLIRRFDKRDKFTQAALWEKARSRRGAGGEPYRERPDLWPSHAAGGVRLRGRLLQRPAQRQQGRHDPVCAGAAGGGVRGCVLPPPATSSASGLKRPHPPQPPPFNLPFTFLLSRHAWHCTAFGKSQKR